MQLKLDAFARGLTVLEGMLFRFDVRNIIRPVLYRRSNGVPREDDLQLLRLVVEKIQQAFFRQHLHIDRVENLVENKHCLLYTSDAADE